MQNVQHTCISFIHHDINGLTKDYVDDADEHLHGTSSIIISKYGIARNHVTVPNCGECDESEVAR